MNTILKFTFVTPDGLARLSKLLAKETNEIPGKSNDMGGKVILRGDRSEEVVEKPVGRFQFAELKEVKLCDDRRTLVVTVEVCLSAKHIDSKVFFTQESLCDIFRAIDPELIPQTQII